MHWASDIGSTPKAPRHPDICLPKYNTVVFVHGCFWHRHEGRKIATTPKSNVELGNEIRRNVERDLRVREQLEQLGWRVLVVWECELKTRLPSLPDEIDSS